MRTSSVQTRPLYGTVSFRAVAGDTLRPGGLALTEHGLGILETLGLGPGARVLDLGCGPGATTQLCAALGYEAVGLDWHPGPWSGSSPEEEAEGAGGTEDAEGAAQTSCASHTGEGGSESQTRFVCGDLHSLPFASQSLDACVAECVLSLVDAPKCLAECARVLKKGGQLLVTDLLLRPEFAQVQAATAPAPSGEAENNGQGLLQQGASCLAGALFPWQWEERFQGAGFSVAVREDHSKALARLVAELVWYDCAGDLDWLLPGGQCSCASDRRRFGYGLWAARKVSVRNAS